MIPGETVKIGQRSKSDFGAEFGIFEEGFIPCRWHQAKTNPMTVKLISYILSQNVIIFGLTYMKGAQNVILSVIRRVYA